MVWPCLLLVFDTLQTSLHREPSTLQSGRLSSDTPLVTGDTSRGTHRRYSLRAWSAASARCGVEFRKISIFSASHCGSVRGGLPVNASTVDVVSQRTDSRKTWSNP